MTDRPLSFSQLMVRALLSGRKTVTRRVLKKPIPKRLQERPISWMLVQGEDVPRVSAGRLVTNIEMPCAIGDRFWVREDFCFCASLNARKPADVLEDESVWYPADRRLRSRHGGIMGQRGRPRSAKLMPQWASRLTLIVTDLDVQRLQYITSDQCADEGLIPSRSGRRGFRSKGDPGLGDVSPAIRKSFAHMWDDLHGSKTAKWAANPWVAVIHFDVLKGNIAHFRKRRNR